MSVIPSGTAPPDVSIEPDPGGGLLRADVGGLFLRYSAEIHRYCASRVGAAVADDVVGETFLLAHKNIRRYDPRLGSPVAWLYGIATNLLHRHRRDEVRALRALARTGHDPLVEDGPAERSAARVDASAQSRRVGEALAAIPTRQRDVLLLFAVAQLEYAEIAAALDIPLGSVQSALHRARTKVRAALAASKEDGR